MRIYHFFGIYFKYHKIVIKIKNESYPVFESLFFGVEIYQKLDSFII